jgi:HEAT repeat protein
MRRTLLPALLVLLASFTLAPAADDNPEFNGKKLSEWAIMLREEQNPRLRKAAVVALSQIANDHAGQTKLVKEVMTTLGKALRNDTAASVRLESARALGKAALQLLEDRAADVGSVIIDLGEGLRVEKDTGVRVETATALGRYGKNAKTAVQPLTAALADKDPKVKEAAAMTLGRIGGDAKSATEELIPLLKDSDATVRKAAVFALGRVEPEDVSKPSLALSPLFPVEKDLELRKELLVSLGLLGDKSPEVVKTVAAGMKKEEPVELRRQAAQSLAKFFVGAKAADKELREAFQSDPDKLVRAHALHSLCLGYGEDAKLLIPVLVDRLNPQNEKEPEVRIAVCDELGAMGPEAQSAVPELRVAQKDPETKVREAATAAMKKVLAKPMPKTDKDK